jgi:hypothetical protein
MSSVLEVMKPEIESTIKRLDLKHFEPDPIAGPHFKTDRHRLPVF